MAGSSLYENSTEYYPTISSIISPKDCLMIAPDIFFCKDHLQNISEHCLVFLLEFIHEFLQGIREFLLKFLQQFCQVFFIKFLMKFLQTVYSWEHFTCISSRLSPDIFFYKIHQKSEISHQIFFYKFIDDSRNFFKKVSTNSSSFSEIFGVNPKKFWKVWSVKIF